MKKTHALIEARDGRTAIIALAEEPLSMYYVVKITHEGGAYTGHPVEIALTLSDASASARLFLEYGR